MNKIVNEDIETIARGISAEAGKLSGRTILISGGAGFLGKYFMGVFQYLNENVLAQPCRVISVDNYITGSKDPDFDWHNGDTMLEVWGRF